MTGNVRINVTPKRVRVPIFVVEKQECVSVALVIQHAKGMHRTIL
jgi:hypothetical protein